MIDISRMPDRFVLCMADEGECPRRAECLRSRVLSEAQESVRLRRELEVVNPLNPVLRYATGECTQFKSCEPVTYARGMSRLFDHVERGVYRVVRQEVEGCFSCRSYFFRAKRGERLITPAEQEAIAAVFRRHGIGEAPCYDSYVTDYEW